MKSLEIGSTVMATTDETTKQQRVLWGCALVVGFILVYYAGAPIIPVVIGCIGVPAVAALRTRLRSKQ
jgi:hypothetical protein